MPSYYSPTYYEDRKREHDFYINLGNQCRIAEEHRQALKKVSDGITRTRTILFEARGVQ